MNKDEVRQLMIKAFKMGMEKYQCDDYPIQLWVEDEINNDK